MDGGDASREEKIDVKWILPVVGDLCVALESKVFRTECASFVVLRADGQNGTKHEPAGCRLNNLIKWEEAARDARNPRDFERSSLRISTNDLGSRQFSSSRSGGECERVFLSSSSSSVDSPQRISRVRDFGAFVPRMHFNLVRNNTWK